MDMDEAKKMADEYKSKDEPQNNLNITAGLGSHGVCPSCGICPTCGRGWNWNTPIPYWWNQ